MYVQLMVYVLANTKKKEVKNVIFSGLVNLSNMTTFDNRLLSHLNNVMQYNIYYCVTL